MPSFPASGPGVLYPRYSRFVNKLWVGQCFYSGSVILRRGKSGRHGPLR